MDAILITAAVVLGAGVGSFANVAIHRWPRGGTVTEPKRSSCPSSGQQIRAVDNLPIVSWLALRGRCRHCGKRIAPRYLLVEAVTAGLFGLTAGIWALDPFVPALLVFVWALVVATVIDLEHRIIPNRLTYRLPFVLLPLLTVAAALDDTWSDLMRGLIAAVAVPGIMLALSELFRLLRGKVGMGMGDIKLAVSIGLVIGYLGGLELAVFAYGSVFSAVVIAIVLMALGRARLASRIPFGPYLAVGSLLVVLAREPLTELLRGVLGL